jgi:hypothetical protein
MKESSVLRAEGIISANNKAIKDFETVCHAGICPTCGKTLILHREIVTCHKSVGIIFKKDIPKKYTRTTIACPEGHELIHPRGHNVDDPGYCVWDGCLNKEIGDHHRRNYDDDDDFGG